MDKTIILIIAISFFIGLTNLVLYLFYRREKNIQKKCTSKIEGLVVDYDNRNEMSIPLPIVEFPKGSVMTVYYNPEKPEKAFVERYASHDRIFKLLIIIFSIIGFVLIAIVLVISCLS